jgi:hypothetical protein
VASSLTWVFLIEWRFFGMIFAMLSCYHILSSLNRKKIPAPNSGGRSPLRYI